MSDAEDPKPRVKRLVGFVGVGFAAVLGLVGHTGGPKGRNLFAQPGHPGIDPPPV